MKRLANLVVLGVWIAACDGQEPESEAQSLLPDTPGESTEVFSYSALACSTKPPFDIDFEREPVSGLLIVSASHDFPGFSFCPVFNEPGHTAPNWNKFTILYQGTAPEDRLLAEIQFLDSTGQVETIAEIEANLLTDANEVTEQSTFFEHSFDFTSRYYWVMITGSGVQLGVGRYRLEVATEPLDAVEVNP